MTRNIYDYKASKPAFVTHQFAGGSVRIVDAETKKTYLTNSVHKPARRLLGFLNIDIVLDFLMSDGKLYHSFFCGLTLKTREVEDSVVHGSINKCSSNDRNHLVGLQSVNGTLKFEVHQNDERT